jgi:cytochrome c553
VSDRPDSPEDRGWSRTAALALVGLIAFSVFVGLVGLPILQAPNAGIDAWTAICRAVGVRPGTPAQPQPPYDAQAQPVSLVRWTPHTLAILASADPKPGGQLAGAVCVNCHGERGFSTSTTFPHLAGQSAEAIYKQLNDFRSGARFNAQMSPVAKTLSEDQLAQTAVYFSHFGDPTGLGHRWPVPDPPIVRLTHRGDPGRGIAPCESCHARGSGGPIEAPVLWGQHQEYLYAQLKAFADGARRNDVYRRMRDIAGRLSAEEMRELAEYYQGLG